MSPPRPRDRRQRSTFHALTSSSVRLSRSERRVLFEAASPLSLAVFRPVLDRLQRDPRIEFWFTTSDRSWDANEIFGAAGITERDHQPQPGALDEVRRLRQHRFLEHDLAGDAAAARCISSTASPANTASTRPYTSRPSIGSFDRLLFANDDRLRRVPGGRARRGRRPARPAHRLSQGAIVSSTDRSIARQHSGVTRPRPDEARRCCTRRRGRRIPRSTAIGAEAAVRRSARLDVNVIVKLHDRSFDARSQSAGVGRLATSSSNAMCRSWHVHRRARRRRLAVPLRLRRAGDRSQLRRVRIHAARPADRRHRLPGADSRTPAWRPTRSALLQSAATVVRDVDSATIVRSPSSAGRIRPRLSAKRGARSRPIVLSPRKRDGPRRRVHLRRCSSCRRPAPFERPPTRARGSLALLSFLSRGLLIMFDRLVRELRRSARRHGASRRSSHVPSLALPAAAPPTRCTSPTNTNVTDILVQYINQENVRLDISSWYLSEHSISIAIANRFAAGVPVRIIGDRGCDLRGRSEHEARILLAREPGRPDPAALQSHLVPGNRSLEGGDLRRPERRGIRIRKLRADRARADLARPTTTTTRSCSRAIRDIVERVQDEVRSDVERHDGRAAEHHRRPAVSQGLERRVRDRADGQLLRLQHAVSESGPDGRSTPRGSSRTVPIPPDSDLRPGRADSTTG